MNHTLQSLLPLLDTPEGLEKLRILTAGADGWKEAQRCSNNLNTNLQGKQWKGTKDTGSERHYYFIPNYTTSLDAIFAAEARLGLHKSWNPPVHNIWERKIAGLMDALRPGLLSNPHDYLSLTAAQRCIPFNLTAQEVRPS